jgi:hypothetical protein
MRDFIVKNRIMLAAIGLGAIAGLVYWKTVGCSSGTCPITAHWHTSAIFGGLFGYGIGGLFTDNRKEEK